MICTYGQNRGTLISDNSSDLGQGGTFVVRRIGKVPIALTHRQGCLSLEPLWKEGESAQSTCATSAGRDVQQRSTCQRVAALVQRTRKNKVPDVLELRLTSLGHVFVN